ncbi:MAG: DegT/DnrJ/EryC1/StrS family aminotransferase [Fidelibacterota bacterium]|nr:MAG: DegT/DnrJ/EryC1/StrS family aminotransferase [Candidatus Neomarinimicrobiota bacterium]
MNEKVSGVAIDPGDIFTWPIITEEDEEAVLEVLRRGAMSARDVTLQFEEEYARWQGNKYALAFNNGTSALQTAMWAVGVRAGDEVISLSVTYWATILPCLSLGATPVFAEVDPDTLTLDPDDIEHRITGRTKAIVAQHNYGHPSDMDSIIAIAKKHDLKVIEDVAHAQGSLYKGKKLGTFGDVSGISLMSQKSLMAGEGGMLTTDDKDIYEHAVAWGHYARFKRDLVDNENLKPYAGLPLGGYKYRMHQLSSAVGRVQLKHYDERCVEVRKAMNLFWDLMEGIPGMKAHRPPEDSKSTMGGWYNSVGLYRPEELGGLSITAYTNALLEAGVPVNPGINRPLHLHPLFHDCDIYGHGKPTVVAFQEQEKPDVPSLPVSEAIHGRAMRVPNFKKFYPEIIEQYVQAFRKVSDNYRILLKNDPGNPPGFGKW